MKINPIQNIQTKGSYSAQKKQPSVPKETQNTTVLPNYQVSFGMINRRVYEGEEAIGLNISLAVKTRNMQELNSALKRSQEFSEEGKKLAISGMDLEDVNLQGLNLTQQLGIIEILKADKDALKKVAKNQGEEGLTIIHTGSKEAVENILNSFDTIEERMELLTQEDKYGSTPVFFANSDKLISLLQASGSAENAKSLIMHRNKGGRTALFNVETGSQQLLIKLLGDDNLKREFVCINQIKELNKSFIIWS